MKKTMWKKEKKYHEIKKENGEYTIEWKKKEKNKKQINKTENKILIEYQKFVVKVQ